MKQLYISVGEDDYEAEKNDELDNVIQPSKEFTAEPKSEIAISIYALIGNNSPQTIMLLGKGTENSVLILIDSGSTHNFLYPIIAQKLGCVIQTTNPIKVRVANREQLCIQAKCFGFL